MSKYIYRPSSAEVFLNCSQSAHLPQNETTNEYMERGTQLHSVAEDYIKNLIEGHEKLSNNYDTHIIYKDIYELFEILKRDLRYDSIRELIKNIEIILEKSISFTDNMGGTPDMVVVNRQRKHLYVIDFKMGEHTWYDIETNKQVDTYVAMVVKELGINEKFKIKSMILTPFTPQEQTFKTYVYEDIQKHIKLLLDVSKNPPSFNEGAWCSSCRAKDACPLYNKFKPKFNSEVIEKIRTNLIEINKMDNLKEVATVASDVVNCNVGIETLDEEKIIQILNIAKIFEHVKEGILEHVKEEHSTNKYTPDFWSNFIIKKKRAVKVLKDPDSLEEFCDKHNIDRFEQKEKTKTNLIKEIKNIVADPSILTEFNNLYTTVEAVGTDVKFK